MKRDAAAYAVLLAGFRAFTLHRRVAGHGKLLDPVVYRGDEPTEVAELRRLLAAHPSDLHCMCVGSAAISLEGGAATAVLSVHHDSSVRWPGATCGDLMLERGRELGEWLAARGVPSADDQMEESNRQRVRAEAGAAGLVRGDARTPRKIPGSDARAEPQR